MMGPALLKMIEKIERASAKHGMFFTTREEGATVIIRVYIDANKKKELLCLVADDNSIITGHIGDHAVSKLWNNNLGTVGGLAVAQIESTSDEKTNNDTLFGLTK